MFTATCEHVQPAAIPGQNWVALAAIDELKLTSSSWDAPVEVIPSAVIRELISYTKCKSMVN